MREWLEDPDAPWWAKLRRAQVHINEVRQRVDALQSAGIWSIEREPAAGGCSSRFRIHRADRWAPPLCAVGGSSPISSSGIQIRSLCGPGLDRFCMM
jgi:hypothetical protein